MMKDAVFAHETVLLHESVMALNIVKNGIYIDGTFGRGGHSKLILRNLGDEGRLLIIDRDPVAIAAAKAINDHRLIIIHGEFSRLEEYVTQQALRGKINGVLLDLGVSSPQLDDAERGFSFMRDGPLDMRMNPTKGQSAAMWLQQAKESDIAWVLKTFGEERFSKRIAKAIVEQNKQQPVATTLQLAEIIRKAVPVKDRYKHPATRSFQAIRIYINSELDEIQVALQGIVNVLALHGRMAVISFHSLEDRIVKRFIRKQSQPAIVPKGLALTELQIKNISDFSLKEIKKIKPSIDEVINNARSRSAILRVAEKVV